MLGNANGLGGTGGPTPLVQLRIGFVLTDLSEPGAGSIAIVPGSHNSKMALPPKPVMEVPLPRMLVPGYGIFDMPTFDAYEPDGLRAQPEAEDDDATSSYNATEIMGSREAEIRRLEAQIKLSFHKEVRGSRIEPRGVG